MGVHAGDEGRELGVLVDGGLDRRLLHGEIDVAGAAFPEQGVPEPWADVPVALQGIDVRHLHVTPRFEVARSEPKALGLKDVVWRTGAEVQVGKVDVDLALPQERREGEPIPAYDPRDTSVRFDDTIWIADIAAWTALSATFDPRVRVTAGVRAEYYARPDETSVQPRGELQIKLAKPWTLIGTKRATAAGVATLVVPVPGSARGKTFFLQCVDQAACRASNLVTEVF